MLFGLDLDYQYYEGREIADTNPAGQQAGVVTTGTPVMTVVPPGGTSTSSTITLSAPLSGLLNIGNRTYDLNNPLFRTCRDSGDPPNQATSGTAASTVATPGPQANATRGATSGAKAGPGYGSLSNAGLLQQLADVLLDPTQVREEDSADSLWKRMKAVLQGAGRVADLVLLERALAQLKSYCSVVRKYIFQALRLFANAGQNDWEAEVREVARRSMPLIVDTVLDGEPIVTLALPPERMMSRAREIRLETEQARIDELHAQEICLALRQERLQVTATNAYWNQNRHADARTDGDAYDLRRGRVYFKTLDEVLKHAPRGELSIAQRNAYAGGVLVQNVRPSPRGRESTHDSFLTKGQRISSKRIVHADYGPGNMLKEVRIRTANGYTPVYLGETDYVVGQDGEPVPYTEWMSPVTLELNRRYANCAILTSGIGN